MAEEAAAPQEGTAEAAEKPLEAEGQPAQGEGQPAEGEGQPAEGEGQPAEGEGQPAETAEPEGGEEAKDEDKQDELDQELNRPKLIKLDMAETASIVTEAESNYISEGMMRFYKYMGVAPEESEATSELKILDEKIDRAPYYERHTQLKKDIEGEIIRNNLIQRKIGQYFKKKRQEHVFKEAPGDPYDNEQKYHSKLDAYAELLEIDARQRTAIDAELAYLRERRETKFVQLTNMFETMQNRERETGIGLINTKTGKVIPDKYVERLLRLQRTLMDTINTMRLRYIKQKDIVTEKQQMISVLDKIGENLYLRDYEQLKIENRGLEDKIEERDEELSRLRNKYRTNLNQLGHVREKSSALQGDIDNLKAEISTIDAACTKVFKKSCFFF